MRRLLLSLAVVSLATFACGPRGTPPPSMEPFDAGDSEAPVELTAPANFQASEISGTGITLSWDQVEGAYGYELFAGEEPNPQTLADSPSWISSRYTQVETGKTYYFRVRAVHEDRKGPDAQLEVTVPPAAPENVTLTGVSDSSVFVEWSASAGATKYRVENCTQFNPDVCTILAETAETSTTLSDLSRGTLLAVRVKAVNDGGESAPSSMINYYTAPEGPAITGIGSDAVNAARVLYEEVTGASKYQLQIAASASGPFVTIDETTSNNAYSTGVRFGETYFYRVVAVNDAGRGVGPVTSFTMPDGNYGLGTPPPVPANVVVTATGPTELEVSFSGSYQIGDMISALVSLDSSGTLLPLSSGAAENKPRKVKWLEPGTQYCIALEAMRPVGDGPLFSARTTPVCVTTPE